MKKLLILFSFVLLLPNLTMADGGLIPPPNYQIYETDQRAVIFFENNIETLILSTKFQGTANNFAWIIPTPSQPQVAKSTIELFNSLNSLTSYTKSVDYFDRVGAGLGMEYGAAPQAVEVLETKQIEYYDITVLKATEKETLNKWLNEHGYQFPTNANYVLDHYISNDWYFTAVKISGDYLSGNLNQATRSGDLIPLSLTFSTTKIVFPLKISSVDYYYQETVGSLESLHDLKFYQDRYQPVYYFLLTKNNPAYPTFWQELPYWTARIASAMLTQLIIDLQQQVNYSASVTSAADFISEAEYNSVLAQVKKYNSPIGSTAYNNYVAYLVKQNFPEIEDDVNVLNSAFDNDGANKTIGNLPSTLRSNPYIQLLIYIIADKVYDYSDFEVQYADWLKKADLENLASKDNGDPWVSPEKNKYVLSRLYKNMRQSEMTNDIYFKESADQLTAFSSHGAVGFYIFIIGAALVTLALGGVLIYLYKKH